MLTTGKERLGYPTQKPARLLRRIIEASSNEGDIILDAYCGCGTTIAVAEQLNRQWIGIDITYQSISSVIKRLNDSQKLSSDAITLHGVPKDIASAKALATKKDERLRKEFEKWAVLTFTNNAGRANDGYGADKGIDGRFYFTDIDDKGNQIHRRSAIQVKSGHVSRKDVAEFEANLTHDKSVLGYFITLEAPTKHM